MAADLILIPFLYELGHPAIGTTELHCARDRRLYDELVNLPMLPVPEEFQTWDGTVRGDRTQLGYVPVATLLLYADYPGVQDHAANAATWAYLGSSPGNSRWCSIGHRSA